MADWIRGRSSAHEDSPVSLRLGLPLAVEASVIAALVIGASVFGMPSAGAQESEPGRLELLLAQSEGIVAPGRIEKQFEDETQAKSTFEPIVPEGDEAVPPGEAEAIKFVLSGVLIEGSTVYDEPEFLPIYETSLGEEVSLADIYRMAGSISAKYRGDGYILSRAVVPAQRIRDGLVRIQAVEGFINEVIIEGDESRRESLLEAYAAKIAAERPLTARTLERYLLLADDLAGLTAKAVLTPSIDLPGASDLVLFVDQKPFDVTLALDNRGTRFVGPYQTSFTANINSLLGIHESTTLRTIFASQPEELRYFQASHTEVLGSEGAKIQMSYSLSRSRPGFTFETSTGTNIESESQELIFKLSYPMIRTRSENLEINTSFTWTKALTDFAFLALFDDRLRILRAGLAYDFVDQFRGINLAEFELSQGLDIFHESTSTGYADVDSPTLSRILGRSDFTKVTADLSRLQRLGPGLTLLASATGQYSRTQLLSGEEFGYGGAAFGRAYDSSEITGDHGAAAKLELQYGLTADDTPMIKDYQIFTFVDFGAVWRIDPVVNGDAQHTKTGSSMGIGVRFNVTDNISGSVEIDKPMTRDVSARGTDGEMPRAFFSLAARF